MFNAYSRRQNNGVSQKSFVWKKCLKIISTFLKLWLSYREFFSLSETYVRFKNDVTITRPCVVSILFLLFSINTLLTRDAVSCHVFSKNFDNSAVSRLLNKKTFVWSQKNNHKYTRYSHGLVGNAKHCRDTSVGCQNIAKPITNRIRQLGDVFFILVSENSYT